MQPVSKANGAVVVWRQPVSKANGAVVVWRQLYFNSSHNLYAWGGRRSEMSRSGRFIDIQQSSISLIALSKSKAVNKIWLHIF